MIALLKMKAGAMNTTLYKIAGQQPWFLAAASYQSFIAYFSAVNIFSVMMWTVTFLGAVFYAGNQGMSLWKRFTSPPREDDDE